MFAGVMSVVAAGGCEASEPDQVRVKAAENFQCARESITVVKTDEPSPEVTVYEAKGCGKTTRYACEKTYDQVAVGGERGGGRSNMRSLTHCRERLPLTDNQCEPAGAKCDRARPTCICPASQMCHAVVCSDGVWTEVEVFPAQPAH